MIFFAKAIRFIRNRYTPRGARHSWSASGEDILIAEALRHFKTKNTIETKRISYIDIGAHDPIFGNNTYLFYKQGGKGIIVEPNISLTKKAQRKRSRDIILTAGAGTKDGEMTFYMFPRSTRNTFSKSQAEEWSQRSGESYSTSSVPVYSLDTIITKQCDSTAPDVISIDAEGYDLEILKGFSWNVRPHVFCVESDSAGELEKILADHSYSLFAKTPANTIFIDTIA